MKATQDYYEYDGRTSEVTRTPNRLTDAGHGYVDNVQPIVSGRAD